MQTEFKTQLLSAKDPEGRVWEVIIAEEGPSPNHHPQTRLPFYYTRAAIEDAVKIFEGAPAFIIDFKGGIKDHPPKEATQFLNRLVRRVAGYYKDTRLEVKNGLARCVATLHLGENVKDLWAVLKNAWKNGIKSPGISINASGATRPKKIKGEYYQAVNSLEHHGEGVPASGDIVTYPAMPHCGFTRLVASFENKRKGDNSMNKELKEVVFHLLESVDSALTEGRDVTTIEDNELLSLLEEAEKQYAENTLEARNMKAALKDVLALVKQNDRSTAIEAIKTLIGGNLLASLLAAKKKNGKEMQVAQKETKNGADVEEAKKKKKKDDSYGDLNESLKESVETIRTEVLGRIGSENAIRSIANSKLPDAAKSRLVESFTARLSENRFFSLEDVQEAIQQERDYIAKFDKSGQVHGLGKIEVGLERMDLVRAGVDGMIFGEDQKVKDKTVPAFSSIKQAFLEWQLASNSNPSYLGITGVNPREILYESFSYVPDEKPYDVQFWHPEMVRSKGRLQEAISTTTWGEIFGDSIRRRMIAEYKREDLQDWRAVVSQIVPLQDWRTNRRVRFGGYGTLPEVAENGTFQPLTSPSDTEETYAPKTYGGLETLSERVIAADDLHFIRMIPVKLGRSSIQRLYKDVYDWFYDSSNTMTDGYPLGYDRSGDSDGHDNLQSSALGVNCASVDTIAGVMRLAHPYGESSQYLGIANDPAILLCSPADYDDAWKVANSPTWFNNATYYSTGAASQAATTSNHWKGRIKPIAVNYWADGEWCCVANPNNIPVIEVGFYQNRQEPMLYVQDQETVGSRFTANKITYKIEFIYGTVALDYRGVCFGTDDMAS